MDSVSEAVGSPDASPKVRVQPGDVLAAKYVIEAVIGRGGSSTVFRARQLGLERSVAVKILDPGEDGALALARAESEAQAAAMLTSHHVVRVFDLGTLPEDDAPYVVLEHLEGADFGALLRRRGPLPANFAVDAMLQACEALAEAHALGIIHRDLKPANLFLTESADGSPFVKVLDFGMARLVDDAPRDPRAGAGLIVGTPAYMAPEQMRAPDAADARSDVWALGAIFYEFLVGHPPFVGRTLRELYDHVSHDRRPRPSAERPELDRAFDQVVTRCLAVDPAERFASVSDLSWALSTLGADRARESAARIARVVERHSVPPPGLLVGAAPPPDPPAKPRASVPPGWDRRRIVRATCAGAGALFVVGVMTFDLLGLASEPEASEEPPSTVDATMSPKGAATSAPPAKEESPPPSRAVRERERGREAAAPGAGAEHEVDAGARVVPAHATF